MSTALENAIEAVAKLAYGADDGMEGAGGDEFERGEQTLVLCMLFLRKLSGLSEEANALVVKHYPPLHARVPRQNQTPL